MRHRGLVEKFANIFLVIVRGVEVDITLEAINSLFCDEKIKKESAYAEKNYNKR